MKHHFIKDSRVLTLIIFIITTLLKLNYIFIIKKYIFIFNINDVFIYNKKAILEVIKIIRLLDK